MAKHKWAFSPRFRTRGFSWKSSSLACQRVKEAVAEIKKVARTNPVLGAEGAILFIEKIEPALEEVDSSSGAIGTAVYKAMEALIPLIIAAEVTQSVRGKWLDRLWQAFTDDGFGYVENLGDHWGQLCGSPEVAETWVDELLPLVKMTWSERWGYFRGTPACLSCLLATGRYQELLNLIDTAPHSMWHNRKFGFKALVALGRTAEALEYAESSRGLNDSYQSIAEACEELLLSLGRTDVAFSMFAFAANRRNSNLATFRAIAKKYPGIASEALLNHLIKSDPGNEHKWFATAKELGQFELALKLATKGPCDIRTLNRAALHHIETNPEFALGVAVASLKWMLLGQFYEMDKGDVYSAVSSGTKAAKRCDQSEQFDAWLKTNVLEDQSPRMFVSEAIMQYMSMPETNR